MLGRHGPEFRVNYPLAGLGAAAGIDVVFQTIKGKTYWNMKSEYITCLQKRDLEPDPFSHTDSAHFDPVQLDLELKTVSKMGGGRNSRQYREVERAVLV